MRFDPMLGANLGLADVRQRVKFAGKGAISGIPRLVFRIPTLLRWAPRAVLRAAFDAGRAWAVSPNRYRLSSYAQNESGGWRVIRRRRFRRTEVLKVKCRVAAAVFIASMQGLPGR